ncbi:hypothetical protein IscW_ISCW000757 [Ixodes scapularis]|uniref:Uncharacterized protein n=1 Tax=Ixodes scapularis TaxID=6945 RepID=B7P0V7_IXOSC|nr:hypothetical protein IscW_ISCW000757 [Ixodes scapularis]|eukprot:XP_002399400.1 hypothetical protein IscW_ISCW000757 [Ixodes scapularis]
MTPERQGQRGLRPSPGVSLRRSQEWQDPYSSSDNEAPFDPPGVAHHQGSGHRHQYEDPRNVVDHRSIEIAGEKS